MLEHARLAIDLGSSRSVEHFDSDRHMRAGIERYIEIIGEAANHVGEPTREDFPAIPWEQIMATRHIIAHGYDVVRPDILWEIVHKHLPTMLTVIESYLAEKD